MMKRLFKIFFIILSFLLSVCPHVFATNGFIAFENSEPIIENVQAQELHEGLKPTEFYIVSTNYLPLEISVGSEREEVFVNCSLDKDCAQNKFLQQITNAKYNQLFLAESHNISSYLKNEICTRAP